MKKILKFQIWLLLSLVLIGTSCEKDFLDVNVDPNNPADATVDLVFPAGTSGAAYVIGGWYQILGGMWAQHWTQSTGAQQYRAYDSYNITTTTLDDRQFGGLYYGALNDLEYVKKTASADNNWTYYLMATVVQCYTYQVLADLYDRIPFSEALQGADNFTPKWDMGQDVYNGLISRLNEALAKDLNASTNQMPGADDIIFNGNMDRWVEFANTLKLKIYMRQCYANASAASSGIQSLYTAGADFLTADAAMTAFLDEANRRNPVYETEWDRFGGVNIVASNTLLNYLLNNGDPRADAIYNTPINGGAHFGLDQGDFFNPGPTNAADCSQPAVSGVDAVYFMSLAESYFLQAEAVVRYGVTGDAKLLYENGIEASFARFGVTGASALYGVGGVYEFPSTGTDEAKLEAIMNQKWVAMANNQGLEAFLEQNRTHYPDFYTLAVNRVHGDRYPKRLLYPDSETVTNPNTPTVQQVYVKVWWDQK
ncbi:SusD/RagB family nutrient-binding outer membrane lipoprotein [Bacteroidota bacterium]